MKQMMLLQTMLTGWFRDVMDRADETGASLVEYALLLALIAVVAIGALVFLGHTVSNQLNNVAGTINNAP
ncbi:MAG TPA: Flp family type IVb pilin [Galbitalea sp.]